MKNRNIILLLDIWRFNSKPSEKVLWLGKNGAPVKNPGFKKEVNRYHTEGSKLRGRICFNSKNVSTDELKEAILKGQTFTIGAYHISESKYARRAEANWKSQDIIGIDIDSGLTPEQFLERCKEVNMYPFFIYTTFSDSLELRKFRALFLLDETCYDNIKMKKGIYAMTAIFSEADTHCTDLARMFYGGKEELYSSKKTINLDKLIIEHQDKIESFLLPKVKGDKTDKVRKLTAEVSPITMKSLNDYINSDDLLAIRGRKFSSDCEFISMLKNIPLHKIFNVEQNEVFKCAFHEDTSPSAYISEKNKYVCSSDKCNMEHSHDIFDVVGYILTERLSNAFKNAVRYLKRELGVLIEISEVQKQNYDEVLDVLTNNLLIADDITMLEDEYPLLWERMNYCGSVYDSLVKAGIRTLKTQELHGFNKDCIVVSMSKSEIGKKARLITPYQADTGVRNRVNDLCSIGFIEQLSDEEVRTHSPELYRSTIELKAKKHACCTINCYKLNPLSTDMFLSAERAIKNKPTRKAQCKETMATRGTQALRKGDGAIDETTSYFIALDKYVKGKATKKKCVSVEEFEKKCLEFKVPGGANSDLAHQLRDFLMNKYKLTEKKKASASTKAQYSLKSSLSSHKFVYCKKTK